VKYVRNPKQAQHAPQTFLVRGRLVASPERPERAEMLEAAARALGLEPVDARPFPHALLLKVHSAHYLDFLASVHARWSSLEGAGTEVVPNVHPLRYAAHCPDHPVGLAGWYLADTACPIGPYTFEAAVGAAQAALTAADLLLAGERQAYALCRPPGHHAFADLAGGFCYLNNAAIAAAYLAERLGRVAVLDIDVHHGNGTQGIFWRRGDVLTLSIHADPSSYYPFYWGYAHETGEGDGRGANRNWPLPVGSGDEVWLEALDEALAAFAAFAPAVVVVALGLDVHEQDPLRGMRVSHAGLHEAGRRIGCLLQPVLLVQEGGYPQPQLRRSLEAFLSGFLAAAGRG
jgi:acetoin utilization deacetylase AcuC-like enzyme